MKSLRNILFQIHLWTGLLAGIFFILLGVSGSVLVYPQLFGPTASPVPAASPGTALPLEQIIAAARNSDPRYANRSATLLLPRQPGTAIGVRFTAQREGGPPGGRRAGRRGRGPDGGRAAQDGEGRAGRGAPNGREGGAGGRDGGATMFVDPPTGKLLGASTPAGPGLAGLAHEIHEAMLLGGPGRTLVAWLGVGMLFLGLSGLYLWWPRKGQWRFAFGVRRNARGARLYREIHGMFGIWFWLVFLFVTATSIPLGFPSVMAMVSGSSARPQGPPPGLAALQPVEVTPGAQRLPLDALLASAAKAASGTPISVTVPAAPNRAVTVAMAGEGPPRNVAVDPYTAEVLSAPAPPPAGGINRRTIEQLHGGDGLGPVWKFLEFLTGFLPLIFVITGAMMWLKKRAARMPMSRPITEV